MKSVIRKYKFQRARARAHVYRSTGSSLKTLKKLIKNLRSGVILRRFRKLADRYVASLNFGGRVLEKL